MRKRRPRYWFDARRRFFVTNHGWPRAVAANVTFALAFGLYRLRSLIQRKPDVTPKWMLWDFVRYSFLPLKLSR
jgi:N-acetylglucosaminyl-diphospho-decaprenol L-rhamnosyltransferase